MVAEGHGHERCSDAGQRCLQEDTACHRVVAQAIGGAQPPPQVDALSLRDVDADILPQSWWQNLSAAQKKKLNQAKDQLRELYGVAR